MIPASNENPEESEHTPAAKIIQYKSLSYKQPLYLIYITDATDKGVEDDHIAEDITEKIIASHSIDRLLAFVRTYPEKMDPIDYTFLADESQINREKLVSFDVGALALNLGKEMSAEYWDTYSDTINLFGDYALRHPNNKKALHAFNDPYIKRAWEYAYEYIFFARWHYENDFSTWFASKERLRLAINYTRLSHRLRALVGIFERAIRIV